MVIFVISTGIYIYAHKSIISENLKIILNEAEFNYGVNSKFWNLIHKQVSQRSNVKFETILSEYFIYSWIAVALQMMPFQECTQSCGHHNAML